MTILKDQNKTNLSENQDPIWRQFGIENNGRYVLGKYGEQDSVEITYCSYKLIFDRYIRYQVVGNTTIDTEYTRIRAELKSPDNLELRITEHHLIDHIGKIFGLIDIQIENYVFDRRFKISGNNKTKVQTIFSNKNIHDLILSQKDFHLHLLSNFGIFNELIPDNYKILYYISETKVTDIRQLNSLLKLYKLVIDSLTSLNSAKPIHGSS